MYTIASGANHGLRYIEETTPGTTPVSPRMVELNHNSCSLTLSRDTFTANACVLIVKSLSTEPASTRYPVM